MRVREGIGELKFTEAQIYQMEQIAKSRGQQEYLLLRLWGRRGLRVSESLGLHKSDITENGVWISQKGGDRVLKMLPPELFSELEGYAKHLGKDVSLFPITRRTAQNWAQSIAHEAGIPNWERAHPHRWRHFFRDLPGTPDREGPVEGKESDGSQGPPGDSGLRRESESRRRVGGIVKIRPFWFLGVLAGAFFYHGYGTLTNLWLPQEWVVSYQTAIIVSVVELFLFPFILTLFLWKLVVYWHDRPYSYRHIMDDPNLLA